MPPISGATQPLPDVVEPAPAPVALATWEPAPVVQSVPTSGAAIAALVFGILGLLGPLYVIGPLLALGFANRASREAARGTLGGAQVARAARILAWTSIVLFVVGGLVVLGFATIRYQTGVGFRFR